MKIQANKLDEKMERLVEWNTDVLVRLLKQIIARQRAHDRSKTKKGQEAASRDIVLGGTVIDEVVEIIELPELDASASRQQESVDELELDPAVVQQVRTYVQTIAKMYRANPFHNFEHVSIRWALATVNGEPRRTFATYSSLFYTGFACDNERNKAVISYRCPL
jgi:hypothetical protein